MSYLKFNELIYSNNDDGTFWPGFVEVPEEELLDDTIISDSNDQKPEGVSQEAQRIITAVILISILFIAFFLGQIFLYILLFIVSLIATKEWHDIFDYKSVIPYPLLLYGALTPSLVIYFYNPQKIYVPLLVFPLGLFLYLTYTSNSEAYDFIGSAYVFHTWFGVGIACIAYVLKNMDSQFTILTILCVALSDSVAYEIGRRFGTKKLAPTISPNKTVEGLVAALLIGTAAYTIVLNYFLSFSLSLDILISLIFIIVGVFGDLFQSKIKRSVDIKDSSNLLPGHGGVLDRLDSYLFCFPFITIILMLTDIF